MKMISAPAPDDSGGLVAKLAAAFRAGDMPAAREVLSELSDRFRIDLRLGVDVEHPSSAKLLAKPPEAAEFLSVSQRKLWSMTQSGEVPHLRLGKSVRYPVDALRRWIDERKQGGEAR